MSSPNGNIFRVAGPLYGEFTDHRWIPRTKTSDTELWCFLWSVPSINDRVNNREAGDLRRHHAHYDVIVMSTANLSPGICKCNFIHCCRSGSSCYERIHKDSWLTYRKWLSHHLINPYFEVSNSPKKLGNMKSDAPESCSKNNLYMLFTANQWGLYWVVDDRLHTHIRGKTHGNQWLYFPRHLSRILQTRHTFTSWGYIFNAV